MGLHRRRNSLTPWLAITLRIVHLSLHRHLRFFFSLGFSVRSPTLAVYKLYCTTICTNYIADCVRIEALFYQKHAKIVIARKSLPELISQFAEQRRHEGHTLNSFHTFRMPFGMQYDVKSLRANSELVPDWFQKPVLHKRRNHH